MQYNTNMEILYEREKNNIRPAARHTDTIILRLLCEADRYGYEIVKLIAERSGASMN